MKVRGDSQVMYMAQTKCLLYECVIYKLPSPQFPHLVRSNSALACTSVSVTRAFAYLRARLSMFYYWGLYAKLVFRVQSCY